MLERTSHPWSDVIYKGFSGGGAAPSATQPAPPRPSRRGLTIAVASAALGVAVVAAALPLIARVGARLPSAPPAASASAALPARAVSASVATPRADASAPAASLAAQAVSASVPPPSALDSAAPRVGPSAPAAPPRPDEAAGTAPWPQRDVIKTRSRRRLEASALPNGAAAVRSRASAATSLANLNEAYAPESTLSAQAADQD